MTLRELYDKWQMNNTDEEGNLVGFIPWCEKTNYIVTVEPPPKPPGLKWPVGSLVVELNHRARQCGPWDANLQGKIDAVEAAIKNDPLAEAALEVKEARSRFNSSWPNFALYGSSITVVEQADRYTDLMRAIALLLKAVPSE